MVRVVSTSFSKRRGHVLASIDPQFSALGRCVQCGQFKAFGLVLVFARVPKPRPIRSPFWAGLEIPKSRILIRIQFGAVQISNLKQPDLIDS